MQIPDRKNSPSPIPKASEGVRIEVSNLPPTYDLGRAEGTLRSSKESPINDFSRVFEHLPECALVLNLDGVIESANQRFRLLTGQSLEKIKGKRLAEFLVRPVDAVEPMEPLERTVERFIMKSIQNDGLGVAFDFQLADERGEPISVHLSGSGILNLDDEIVGVAIIGRDMSETIVHLQTIETLKSHLDEFRCSYEKKVGDQILEAKQKAKMLEELSITDELTKLYNRRYLFKRLGEEIHRSNRFGTPFSLVILDIDHFKLINDTYGHQTGDMVLYELAGLLRGSIRQVDVVARTGGEEFIILLPGVREAHAYIFCERLREKIRAFQFTFLPEGRTVTVSMGIADFPRSDPCTVDELVQLSDKALYKAKETRNTTWTSASL